MTETIQEINFQPCEDCGEPVDIEYLNSLEVPLCYVCWQERVERGVINKTQKVINMYNAKNFEKIEKIPAGEVADAVIIDIADGTARKFITNEKAMTKYKNLDEPHINVTLEFKYKTRSFRIDQMFSYIEGENGKVLFTDNSNLGKFYKFYKTLPEVGLKVRVSSNADGFFRLMY